MLPVYPRHRRHDKYWPTLDESKTLFACIENPDIVLPDAQHFFVKFVCHNARYFYSPIRKSQLGSYASSVLIVSGFLALKFNVDNL